MAILKWHFGGTVTRLDDRCAEVRVETLSPEAEGVRIGDVVTVMRADFMNQMPRPALNEHAEGNVCRDTDTQQNTYINLIRPV